MKIGDKVRLLKYKDKTGTVCALSGTDETCLARYGEDLDEVTVWMPMAVVEVLPKEEKRDEVKGD